MMLIITLAQVRVTVNFDSLYLVAEDIQWLTNLEVLILSNNLLRVSIYNLLCKFIFFGVPSAQGGQDAGTKLDYSVCVGYFPLATALNSHTDHSVSDNIFNSPAHFK